MYIFQLILNWKAIYMRRIFQKKKKTNFWNIAKIWSLKFASVVTQNFNIAPGNFIGKFQFLKSVGATIFFFLVFRAPILNSTRTWDKFGHIKRQQCGDPTQFKIFHLSYCFIYNFCTHQNCLNFFKIELIQNFFKKRSLKFPSLLMKFSLTFLKFFLNFGFSNN